MIADQAAIAAGFAFRRYAMKPRPAKPSIIIAHVEGSGTAETGLLPIPSLMRSENWFPPTKAGIRPGQNAPKPRLYLKYFKLNSWTPRAKGRVSHKSVEP